MPHATQILCSPARVVAVARTWLGTRYVHQGRLKGVGVDCIGVVVGVAHECGISDYDTRDYAARPNPPDMTAKLQEHLDLVPFCELRPGDILHLRVRRDPQHLAIVTCVDQGVWILHAYCNDEGVGECKEERLGDFWEHRVVACYRYRGVA